MTELEQLQANRQSSEDPAEASVMDGFSSETELFAAFDAGYVPPYVAEYFAKQQAVEQNGFVFSNEETASVPSAENPLTDDKAA